MRTHKFIRIKEKDVEELEHLLEITGYLFDGHDSIVIGSKETWYIVDLYTLHN